MHKAPSASAALTPERPAAPVALVARLEATCQDLLRLRRVRTLLRTAVALLLLAGLLACGDWVWVFGTNIRAAGLIALAVLAVAGTLRSLVAGWGGPRRRDVAVEVERAFPALGQSVRTTVEYVEPAADTVPASPGLVRALTRDTDQRTRELPLQNVVPWRSLRLPAACLALLVLTFAALLAWNPELRTAALRLALRPAQYTNLEVDPGDCTLKIGSDLTVQATVSGRSVSHVDLFYREVGSAGEWKSVSLVPPEAAGKLRGRLQTTLRDCREDLEYRVVAGPVESPVYRLGILRPLALKKIEAAVEPPAYSRKPAAVVPEGNLTVLQGSRVRLQFTLDRPPAEASLSLAASPDARATTIPLRIAGSELTGELAALEKDVVYEVHAQAADGMKLEPARFRIQVQPDRKPSVQLLHPREQLEVTPTTEVRLKVHAGDDLGLGKVGIVYQVGSGPAKILYLREPAGQPASHDAEAVLALEEHALSFQDAITYYAFAEDNRPGQPQRATTELQFIDIRPFKREYQIVQGGGGCCHGASVTLEELIARQRLNLQRTFRQSDQAPADPEAGQRLGKTERELAAATEEFTAGMEQRAGGPIPALHEALQAMQTAAAALERTELEPGREAEQAALAGLIKARKNLRQILKDSQCASACQKLDAQQKQKLRKPPEKDKKEQVKLRQAVEKLAQEEKKLAEEISPSAGGAQLEKKDSGKPSSSGSPLERQQKAAQAAKELQQQVAREETLKGLPRERMDTAARAIEQSARDLEGQRDAAAGQRAVEAAKELERLARQIEALQAAEWAARLAAAQSLARQVARGQEELNKDVKEGAAHRPDGKQAGGAARQAERQKDLAENAKTLADLLKKYQEQAEEKNPPLGQALRQARAAHPPEEAAEHMRRAAAALHEGRPHEGSRDAEQAARLAEALARALEAARRGFLQPQLAQLLAAEKKAAAAHKALHSANSAAKKAEAEKKLTELHDALDKLPSEDKKLTEAAAALGRTLQHEVFWDRAAEGKPDGGNYIPPYEYVDTVQRVARVLQAKIQEVILKDALLDKDEPVPPQFKALVEDYYRILSEDLR